MIGTKNLQSDCVRDAFYVWWVSPGIHFHLLIITPVGVSVVYSWKYLRANLNIEVAPDSACRTRCSTFCLRWARTWLPTGLCVNTHPKMPEKDPRRSSETCKIWRASPCSYSLRLVTEAVCFPGDVTRTTAYKLRIQVADYGSHFNKRSRLKHRTFFLYVIILENRSQALPFPRMWESSSP